VLHLWAKTVVSFGAEIAAAEVTPLRLDAGKVA